MYCTHQTVQNRMYSLDCTHQTVHIMMYSQDCTHQDALKDCTHKTVHTRMYSLDCTHYAVHTRLYTLGCTHKTVHTRLYTLGYTHQTVHTRMNSQDCTHQDVLTRLHPKQCGVNKAWVVPWQDGETCGRQELLLYRRDTQTRLYSVDSTQHKHIGMYQTENTSQPLHCTHQNHTKLYTHHNYTRLYIQHNHTRLDNHTYKNTRLYTIHCTLVTPPLKCTVYTVHSSLTHQPAL